MICNLAELIAPASEAELLDHFGRKEPCLWHGDPAEIGGLIGLDEVNALLATGMLRRPRVRLARSGELVPGFMYSTDDNEIIVRELLKIIRKGASLVIDDIGKLVPRLRKLERAVERRLRANTMMNAYVTFHEDGAFAAHYDNHDVIVVQVHGEKHWQLFGPIETPELSIRKWKSEFPRPRDVVFEKVLKQGDIVFIPRGMWHRVYGANSLCSLHIAVTIVSATGMNYAEWLLERLRSDNLFTRDTPQLGDKAALREHEMLLKSRLADLMHEGSLEQFLAEQDSEREPDPACDLGRAMQLDGSDLLVSLLRRALPVHGPQHGPEHGTQGPGAKLRVGGQSLSIGAETEAVLRLIDGSVDGVVCADLLARLQGNWPTEFASGRHNQAGRQGSDRGDSGFGGRLNAIAACRGLAYGPYTISRGVGLERNCCGYPL